MNRTDLDSLIPRTSIFRSKRFQLIFFLVCIALLGSSVHLYNGSSPQASPLFVEKPVAQRLLKPAGVKLHAMVFYGRRDRVEILECYLRRNLVENGGLIDAVEFIQRTNDVGDIAYLDKLVQSSSSYVRIVNEIGDFSSAWTNLKQDILYLKIDDDIVFIAEDAVQTMIEYKLNHPETLAISANCINNPAWSWVHGHLGAVHPFLPERHNMEPTNWRVSALPDGPDPTEELMEADYNYKHRWLPVRKATSFDNTPITLFTYDAFGPGWTNWRMAAQEHMSFLHNLEEEHAKWPHSISVLQHVSKIKGMGLDGVHSVGGGESGGLSRYHVERWDMNYDRLSINFIMFWGRDIIEHGPVPGEDELYIAEQLTRKIKRHIHIVGRAIVSHFSFDPQREGLERTDILARYKMYASEMVCPGTLLAKEG